MIYGIILFRHLYNNRSYNLKKVRINDINDLQMCAKQLQRVMKKHILGFFLQKYHSVLERPLTVDRINIWKRISTANMSQFAYFAWQSIFVWPHHLLKITAVSIGRFWVICTKCNEALRTKQQKVAWLLLISPGKVLHQQKITFKQEL